MLRAGLFHDPCGSILKKQKPFSLARKLVFFHALAFENKFSNRRMKKARHIRDRLFLLSVIRAGFEPTTRSLEGCCSIQLSYRTKSGCKNNKVLIATQN